MSTEMVLQGVKQGCAPPCIMWAGQSSLLRNKLVLGLFVDHEWGTMGQRSGCEAVVCRVRRPSFDRSMLCEPVVSTGTLQKDAR